MTAPLPRRNDDRIATASFDGEAVLYDIEETRVHLLNGTAALVWQLCDGIGTVGELVDDLAAAFDTPRAEVAQGVQAVLDDFAESGLLAD